MTGFNYTKTSVDHVRGLRAAYLSQLASPLDGMWESFADFSDHYAIERDNQTIGYCIINSDQKLLQFHVDQSYEPRPIFEDILSQLKVIGAVVATNQPQYLSLCLERQQSVAVNAITYVACDDRKIEIDPFPAQTEFKLVGIPDLDIAVDFAAVTLGANIDWLRGYYSERIDGKELFGLWKGRKLLAVGECRPSETQQPFADLGVVVSQEYRQQGLATYILRSLVRHCEEQGLSPICSTENGNIAAQKAIEKSGLISANRILDIEFL